MELHPIQRLHHAVERIRFTTLLLALVLLIFIAPFFIGSDWGAWFISSFLALVLIAIIFLTLEKRYLIPYAILFALIVEAINISSLVTDIVWLSVIYLPLSMLFFSFAIVLIVKHVFRQREITLDLIFAALCVYLLLALVYASAFELIELLSPGSFIFNNAHDAATTPVSSFNLAYFSFTTLTTVGFGDIIATSIYAKSIVILEEITGVLYLAVLVSRLVAGLVIKNE